MQKLSEINNRKEEKRKDFREEHTIPTYVGVKTNWRD